MGDLTLQERCREEMRLLGFCVSAAHPLMLVSAALPEGVVPASRMRRHAGRRAQMAGWAIAAKLIRTRKDGRAMKFLSCEDLTGTFEAVLFPEAYERLAPLSLGPGPYLFRGRIQWDQGSVSLDVEDLEILKTGLMESED